MIHLTAETPIQLAVKPVDFRRQINGLVALCKNQLQQVPNSGICFVFINRARTMIRILVYENNGYWLSTKRLSRGRYGGWPDGDSPLSPMKASKLVALLKGPLASLGKNS